MLKTLMIGVDIAFGAVQLTRSVRDDLLALHQNTKKNLELMHHNTPQKHSFPLEEIGWVHCQVSVSEVGMRIPVYHPSYKNQKKMFLMFIPILGIDEDVINEDNDKLIKILGKYLRIITNDRDIVNLLLLRWLLGDEIQNGNTTFTQALLRSYEGYDIYGCTTPFSLGKRDFPHSGEKGEHSSHDR
ncbi:hypothetical protein L1987_18884 [Smallanthus sonchifolius]|uniref:Uncharacterized protein n=1 Tax=Smallanthus sonchifolius TaxID=185202 RepID=A0ACB9J4F3_9ASTR|nr:hypothetical protein L1987_18884 [Smallanthus sonchifolius]